MTVSQFLRRISFLLLFTVPGLAISADKNSQSPLNVVMIVADDLGWTDLGCYGSDLNETPHLDKLARQGIRFTDGYAASICSPTRASLLTGKHYARLQMTIWREASQTPPRDRKLIPPVSIADLPYSEVTLAEVFQKAGYQTALVGKWHLGDANYYPETQGFDINIGGTLWGAPQTYFFPYRGMGRFGNEFRYVPRLDGGKQGEYLTDRLTDEALKVIDRAGDQPFFLYLAHHAPHTPIEAPADLVQYYEKKAKSSKSNHRNPKYSAMVHSLDQSVGRIMQRLDDLGLSDRSLIVFVSDNGGHIGEFDSIRVTNNDPLRSGKGALYEGGIRVPLIIRGPGIDAVGSTCSEPVYVADLFPTILELAGQSKETHAITELDGLSLRPLLQNPSTHLERAALYFHFPHYYPTTTPASAIRERDWKLLEFYEDNHVELYHLPSDLGETNDLAAKTPDQVTKLRTRLSDWRQSVNARMPTQNPQLGRSQ